MTTPTLHSSAALVTGCSSGIGRAAALALHEAGFVVHATARRPETLADLAERGLTVLALDVTDEATMQSAVDRVVADHGAVGVLVNNAGYALQSTVEEAAMDDVRRQFETNVFGLTRLTQLVLPGMRAQRWGRIINIGSMGGRFTFPGGGFYHASKHAVEALSDALRLEVAPFGIAVSLVQPGPVQTAFGDAALDTLDVPDDGPYAQFNAELAARYAQAYDEDGRRNISPGGGRGGHRGGGRRAPTVALRRGRRRQGDDHGPAAQPGRRVGRVHAPRLAHAALTYGAIGRRFSRPGAADRLGRAGRWRRRSRPSGRTRRARPRPAAAAPGTPSAIARAGTSVPGDTTAPAATSAPLRTTTPCSSTEPEPMRQSSSTVQPSRCARWPTTQPDPMSVGRVAVQCTTVPSWIEVRSPTRISPWSPRRTAVGHTVDPAPSVTRPITTASGCTQASGWMSGTRSPSA